MIYLPLSQVVMQGRASWLRLWVVVAAAAAAGLSALGQDTPASKERYRALLRDGTEVTGPEIKDWKQEPKFTATLGGRPLFSSANPVRVLVNTRQQAALRPPYLQLANGDVLPGAIVRYVPADPRTNQPACVVVALGEPLRGWNCKGNEVAVRVEQVRRVVAPRVALKEEAGKAGGAGNSGLPAGSGIAAHPDRGTPGGERGGGSAQLADGRHVPVQAVRWLPDGVRLLIAEGAATLAYADLTLLELPGNDGLAAVLADGTAPSPDPAGAVGRLATAQGAVLTCRQPLWRVMGGQFRGTAWEPGLAVQPAWAVTPIAVPIETLVSLGCREPGQVALSLLPAQTLAQRSFTGYTWEWQRNRGVRGGILASERFFSDLGLGTHSYAAVAFDLPAGARRFSTLVGVDASAGEGGCVRCVVLADREGGAVLAQSGFLRGGERPAMLSVGALGGAKRLVLVTDYGHDGRPAGADPLDVRDEVAWLWPMVEVEAAALPRAAEAPAQFLPALEGWKLEGPGAATARWIAAWDHAAEQWEPALQQDGADYQLTRQVQVDDQAAVLEAGAVYAGPDYGRMVAWQLRVEGKEVAPTAVAHPGRTVLGKKREGHVQRWSLEAYRGRQVTLALRAKEAPRPNQPPAGLALRGLALLPAEAVKEAPRKEGEKDGKREKEGRREKETRRR